jgi:hypothetical protein
MQSETGWSEAGGEGGGVRGPTMMSAGASRHRPRRPATPTRRRRRVIGGHTDVRGPFLGAALDNVSHPVLGAVLSKQHRARHCPATPGKGSTPLGVAWQ